MINAAALPFAIVGHLAGDYLLQNDWQANGKKKSSAICAIHCVLWTLSVATFSGWWAWWVLLILFATHFIQDRTTIIRWWMGKVGQNGFATHLAPWSIIAVDNTFHIVVLAIIAKFIT